MKTKINSGETILHDLAEFKRIHRDITRWRVVSVVIKRAPWIRTLGMAIALILGGLQLLLLTFVMLFGGDPPPLTFALMPVVLAVLTLMLEWVCKPAFVSESSERRIHIEPRLRVLRYLLFKEKITNNREVDRKGMSELSEIADRQREIDQSVLDRHPVYLVLLTVSAVLLGGGAGQSALWELGIGPVLAVWTIGMLAFWWLLRKPIAAIVMLPGYREQEFCFFLKTLSVDLIETPTTALRLQKTA